MIGNFFISCLRRFASAAARCGRGFRQFADNFHGPKTKMFLNLKINQHAKFEPSNFKIGWLRVVQSLDALHRVSPKSNNNNLWMLVKPWSFEIKGSNFKCIAFLTIQNFFVLVRGNCQQIGGIRIRISLLRTRIFADMKYKNFLFEKKFWQKKNFLFIFSIDRFRAILYWC